MAFIARLDKPCTHCNVVIAKGTSGGFTWDRSKGGFIHLDCLKARKGEPVAIETVTVETVTVEPVAVDPLLDVGEKCPFCGVADTAPWADHYSTCKARIAFEETAKMVPAPVKVSKESGAKRVAAASAAVNDGAAAELARLIQSLAGQRGIDEKEVRRIAADEASKVSHTRSISVTVGEASPVKFDLAHEDLPTVIRLASMRDDSGHRPNVYLYGPAGSGKSTAARQVSKALFPDAADKYGYISLNPQTPESRLIGYMHAGGEYVATEFFKKFTTGGVFCIDEIDNAAASLLATLNGLLANGHGAFPHGVFERHADFVCIATGNTIGLGGDVNYPERRPLDGATRDRFYFMAWGYDMELISAVLTGILGNGAAEFMQWVKRETQELQARYPTHIVSPRAYIQGASLEKIGGYTRNQIRDMVIARGLK